MSVEEIIERSNDGAYARCPVCEDDINELLLRLSDAQECAESDHEQEREIADVWRKRAHKVEAQLDALVAAAEDVTGMPHDDPRLDEIERVLKEIGEA